MLGREQGFELGIKWLRWYFYIVPRMWYPGYIMNYLIRPVRQLIPSPWLPVRVLADIQRFDLMNSDSLELMRSIAYVFGVIAFWEMAPGVLLEVDPTLVLDPGVVRILKRVILHKGCLPLEALDGEPCTCLGCSSA